MARLLKFRTWNGKKFVLDDDTLIQQTYPTLKFEILPIEGSIVEQYSGFLDMNSKEIYEGDIITSKSTYAMKLDNQVVFKGVPMIVEFKNGAFMVIDSIDELADDTLYDFIKGAHDITIIGNIHENSHLLKNYEN